MIDFRYKKLAVEVPNADDIKPTVQGRVLQYAKQKLVGLKLVFKSGVYNAGDIVYVPSNTLLQQWAKESFVLEDKEFVLLDESAVYATTNNPNAYRPDTFNPYGPGQITLGLSGATEMAISPFGPTGRFGEFDAKLSDPPNSIVSSSGPYTHTTTDKLK
jgi:hypothetical protein